MTPSNVSWSTTATSCSRLLAAARGSEVGGGEHRAMHCLALDDIGSGWSCRGRPEAGGAHSEAGGREAGRGAPEAEGSAHVLERARGAHLGEPQREDAIRSQKGMAGGLRGRRGRRRAEVS